MEDDVSADLVCDALVRYKQGEGPNLSKLIMEETARAREETGWPTGEVMGWPTGEVRREVRPEVSAGLGPIDGTSLLGLKPSLLFPAFVFLICVTGGIDSLEIVQKFLFSQTNMEGTLEVLGQDLPVVIVPPPPEELVVENALLVQ
jgi:hypothetical protein